MIEIGDIGCPEVWFWKCLWRFLNGLGGTEGVPKSCQVGGCRAREMLLCECRYLFGKPRLRKQDGGSEGSELGRKEGD